MRFSDAFLGRAQYIHMLHLLLGGFGPGLVLRAPSVPNFRDLGGITCADGRVIRPGLLWRSASPANISGTDAEGLVGRCSVLDLRSQHDAEKDIGERLLASSTQHVPLISEDAVRSALKKRALRSPLTLLKLLSLSTAKKISPSRRLRRRIANVADARLARLLDQVSLSDVYHLIMTQRQTEVRQALEVCLEQFSKAGNALSAPGSDANEGTEPLLVHCTHGKDRTGVLVALVLTICGVAEEDILEDYAQSHEWGCSEDGEWAMVQGLPEKIRDHVAADTIRDWCAAPEAALEEALERIREQYDGSIDNYLDSIGIDAAFRATLAAKLTTA